MANSASGASEDSTEPYWKGNRIDEIYRGLGQFELQHLPPIEHNEKHKVLFELPINSSEDQPPKPHAGKTKWDSNHVRLPCAAQNTINIDGEEKRRWDVIETALLQPIKSIEELENAILTYNPKYVNKWSFGGLHDLIDELDEDASRNFFDEILPAIIRLALQLPTLIPNAIPLLKHGRSRSISMTQQQVACLLANAFLCTFPRRNMHGYKSEYGSYPNINFARLFMKRQECVNEKVKCIIHYFRRVCQKMPTGVVTFSRRSRSLGNFPQWSKCQETFTPSMLLHVTAAGTIEDNGNGLLQVDFANKYLGGGVLSYGCVQEEIRFVICPELLCSMLFTERMTATEAVFMMGCERFCSYDGYASSFHYTGDYVDETPRDQYRRRVCTVVAIDATPYDSKSQQYENKSLYREINKAFVGFQHTFPSVAPGIATGNWGCGAFNGDKHLKSLLQLIVCGITNRPMVYFTFGDAELCDDIFNMFQFLTKNHIKIADLWRWILDFRKHKLRSDQLLQYFMQQYHDLRMANRKKASTSPTTSVTTVLVSTSTTSLRSGDGPTTSEAVEQLIDGYDDSYFADIQEPTQDIDNSNHQPKSEASSFTELVTATVPGGEAPEKRQRSSLLDCLDQSYIEKPSKMKRESTPSPDYDLIIAGDDQTQAINDDQTKQPDDDMDSHQSDKMINDQTDKLQSLQVLDESSCQQIESANGEQLNANGNVGENNEPVQSSSTKSPAQDKNQRKIVDFFKTKSPKGN